jgi:tripeptide aminopeptidase
VNPRAPLAKIVDDLIAIASIPAPTFAEGERIAWLEERLRTSSGTRWRDDAGNLIWSIGDCPPEILITAHLDTVFDAATPHEIFRDDGFLRGPGIGDNAAAVAVALNVFENLPCPLSAAVAFTVGEEGLGNLRGAREAVATLKPAAVIALEGHGLDRIVVDAVGSVRARVGVRGPGGHPWVDRGAPSALHALFTVGAALFAAANDDLIVNIGTVAGGRTVNSIADCSEFLVEARSLDSKLLESFDNRLGALDVQLPLEVEVEILGRRPAGRLDRDSPLLRVVLEVREELGLGGVLDAGSTDANAPLALGIPALSLGVANGAGMHTPGEWIDWRSLGLGYAQIEHALARLAI